MVMWCSSIDDLAKLEDSASVLYAINEASTKRNMIEQENPTKSLVAWPAGNLMLVLPPEPLLQKRCTFHRKARELYTKKRIKSSNKIGFLAAHREKPINVLGWDLFCLVIPPEGIQFTPVQTHNRNNTYAKSGPTRQQ